MHFLVRFGNVKKHKPQSCIFDICMYSLLDECGPVLIMASIRKIGTKKVPHSARLTGEGVKSYLGNAPLNGPVFKKGLP